jgi:membrane protease YdiL (CAAX protease family)
MSARGFWCRIALATALALGLLLVVAPPRPRAHLAPWAAAAAGALAGTVLSVVAVRSRPRRRSVRLRAPVAAAKHLVLGLCAANEEIVWRRVALGELLPAGALVALGSSSLGFALVHRRSRLLHIGTGCAFGATYLATGLLVASIAAHWAYNACVGFLVPRPSQ